MARDIIADRSPALAWEGAMARILIAVFGFCLLALGASPAAHAAKRVAFELASIPTTIFPNSSS
jgi:hypothetical protein